VSQPTITSATITTTDLAGRYKSTAVLDEVEGKLRELVEELTKEP